jgi:hypothetical protein
MTHVTTPSPDRGVSAHAHMLTHAFCVVGEFTCDDRWRPTFHFTDHTPLLLPRLDWYQARYNQRDDRRWRAITAAGPPLKKC